MHKLCHPFFFNWRLLFSPKERQQPCAMTCNLLLSHCVVGRLLFLFLGTCGFQLLVGRAPKLLILEILKLRPRVSNKTAGCAQLAALLIPL